MKILLISRPRCRTSVFCDTTAQFYNIPNFHEELDYAQTKKNDLYKLQLSRKTNLLADLQSLQLTYIKKVTDKVQIEDGIIKLFPRHILTYKAHQRYRMAENFYEFEYLCNTNISNLFKLNSFDQIFFLERDLLESALSYATCIKTGHWLFPNNKKLINYANKMELDLGSLQFNELDFYIFEYLLYLQLKEFILHNYTNCTILHYNNCIDFIKNNYKNLEQAITVDPKFDYSSKFKNYDEIVNYINLKHSKYQEIFPTFHFT